MNTSKWSRLLGKEAAKRFEFFFFLINRSNWNMFAVSINFLLPSSLLLQSRTCGPRADWWNSSLNFLYLGKRWMINIYFSLFDELKHFWVSSDTIFILQSQCSKDKISVKLRRKYELKRPSKSEMCKFSTRVNCWWTILIPQWEFAQKSRHGATEV